MSQQRKSCSAVLKRLLFACVLALPVVVAPLAKSVAATPITVFAAASLTDVLQKIGDAYKAATGQDIRFSFASSSTLARQIAAGAPADIYASANEKWMDYVEKKGVIDGSTRISPVSNQLVLVAPKDSKLAPVTVSSKLDLGKLLGDGGRIAIGNTDSVPAGIYAKQALQSLGIWASAEPKLAPSENVRVALAHVDRGETPLGIVYATDAEIDPNVKVLGAFPPSSHRAITYPFAILKGHDTPAVNAFFAYLTGPKAMPLFRKYGFATN